MKRYDQLVFVCTANTLLSPIAEGIYRNNSPDWMPRGISRGLVVLFEEPINPKCNVLLTQNGFAISGHSQSRQLVKEDLTADTLVLTMTLSEKVKLIEAFEHEQNVYTIGEFVGEDTDMADPGGSEEEKYKECFDELMRRVNKVIQKLEELYWEA
jgi:protein-tyrosine-phosphatase